MSEPARLVLVKVLLCFSLSLAALLFLGASKVSEYISRDEALVAQGITEAGTVYAVGQETGRHGPTPVLSYSYQVDGRIYYGKTRARGPIKNLRKGDALLVTFLPDHPELSAHEPHAMVPPQVILDGKIAAAAAFLIAGLLFVTRK